jgi:hypothetical protein
MFISSWVVVTRQHYVSNIFCNPPGKARKKANALTKGQYVRFEKLLFRNAIFSKTSSQPLLYQDQVQETEIKKEPRHEDEDEDEDEDE